MGTFGVFIRAKACWASSSWFGEVEADMVVEGGERNNWKCLDWDKAMGNWEWGDGHTHALPYNLVFIGRVCVVVRRAGDRKQALCRASTLVAGGRWTVDGEDSPDSKSDWI